MAPGKFVIFPFCVPSATVKTGMPAAFAFAAPSSGWRIPRVWWPSERKRIDTSELAGLGVGATVRTAASEPFEREARRLQAELHGGGEGVADRGAAEAAERSDVGDRLAHELVVGRRRHGDVGLAGEEDQPDLQPLRHAVEERVHRRSAPR